jgi:hypothetical protein
MSGGIVDKTPKDTALCQITSICTTYKGNEHGMCSKFEPRGTLKHLM